MVTVTLSLEDWHRILRALDVAAEDEAYRAEFEDKRNDPNDEREGFAEEAERYGELFNRLNPRIPRIGN